MHPFIFVLEESTFVFEYKKDQFI